jgi:hypothetical protein
MKALFLGLIFFSIVTNCQAGNYYEHYASMVKINKYINAYERKNADTTVLRLETNAAKIEYLKQPMSTCPWFSNILLDLYYQEGDIKNAKLCLYNYSANTKHTLTQEDYPRLANFDSIVSAGFQQLGKHTVDSTDLRKFINIAYYDQMLRGNNIHKHFFSDYGVAMDTITYVNKNNLHSGLYRNSIDSINFEIFNELLENKNRLLGNKQLRQDLTIVPGMAIVRHFTIEQNFYLASKLAQIASRNEIAWQIVQANMDNLNWRFGNTNNYRRFFGLQFNREQLDFDSSSIALDALASHCRSGYLIKLSTSSIASLKFLKEIKAHLVNKFAVDSSLVQIDETVIEKQIFDDKIALPLEEIYISYL